MINYVEAKYPDYSFIEKVLSCSSKENWWANFGPASRMLENELKSHLEVPNEKAAVACCSGTQALFGLVNLYAYLEKKSLKWVVSGYTFQCQAQGPLAESIVVDCDENGFLDINSLFRLKPSSFDGIIVTNIFGKALHVERYIEYARDNNKLLIFDSSSCFYSKYKNKYIGNFGDAEVFSFHHTKPFGFGEGGCVVLEKEYEDIFRSIINFGLYKHIDTKQLSMNGKMSDVASAFILDRLRTVEKVGQEYRKQYFRIYEIVKKLSLNILNEVENEGGIPSVVPILFPNPVSKEGLENKHIVLHKYYRPLSGECPKAHSIYDHIVLFPCHSNVENLGTMDIEDILKKMT